MWGSATLAMVPSMAWMMVASITERVIMPRWASSPGNAVASDVAAALMMPTGPRSAEAAAQQRQHARAEEPYEARLVRSRGMEHQVVESQLHVAADLLGHLLRIAGDDPARGRALD